MTTRTQKLLTRHHRSGPIEVPYIELTGDHDGPTLTIVAGVHGCEFAGIEATRRLVAETDFTELAGRLRVIPVASLPAFYGRSEWYVPIDGKNLGRQFPGDANGSYSQALADLIFSEVVVGSDALLDIHGGDLFEALVPYTNVPEYGTSDVSDAARDMALAYDLPFVVSPHGASNSEAGHNGTLWEAACAAGIPAALQESGGQGLLTESDVLTHLTGQRNTLRHLGMLPGEPERSVEQRQLKTGFWKPDNVGMFYPEVELADHVEEGQVIGRILNVFGEEIEEMRAPHEAWIIAIVTALGCKTNGMITHQVAY